MMLLNIVKEISIDLQIDELLFPNVLTMAVQLCSTGLLFFLIYKFTYKPVKEILDKRREQEQSKLLEAEKYKEEAKQANAKAQESIDKAITQADEIIAKAQADGIRVKENLVKEAQKRSQQLLDDANASIELQKSKMLDEMHEEIVDIAMSAAEKMLQKKLNDTTDKDSIENFIKEVTNK